MSYAPPTPSPFQCGGDGFPAQETRAATPAAYIGMGAAGTPPVTLDGSASPQRKPACGPVQDQTGYHDADYPDHAPSADPLQWTERQIGRAFQDYMNEQSRLPPAGATGFDPRLTPAWAGVKMRV